MDYMNIKEKDLEQMFEELNKIVAILSFENNQRICEVLHNQYNGLVKEIKDLIIGKVRDLDEARQKAKELAEQVDNLITISQKINDQVSKFI